ncbi:MAG: HEPN domain-containing protein [Anaerolineae bacterium]
MEEQRKRTISAYLTRSHEDIDTARLLFANGRYKVALTRAYYAIFYAASAMLLSEDIKRSKHSGVQSFIKSGIIEAEYSGIYGAARDARELHGI